VGVQDNTALHDRPSGFQLAPEDAGLAVVPDPPWHAVGANSEAAAACWDWLVTLCTSRSFVRLGAGRYKQAASAERDSRWRMRLAAVENRFAPPWLKRAPAAHLEKSPGPERFVCSRSGMTCRVSDPLWIGTNSPSEKLYWSDGVDRVFQWGKAAEITDSTSSTLGSWSRKVESYWIRRNFDSSRHSQFKYGAMDLVGD
jgi:hypothetical protein